MAQVDLSSLAKGIPLDPLPELLPRDPSVPHAPTRPIKFTPEERKLAIKNALRYFPANLHSTLAPEFAQELSQYGHIYMYRFRPTHYPMKAYPISAYPAKLQVAKAIQLMIQNNLDPAVAQFPHELVTYGGNGAVLSNWAQYHLVMKYLSEMTDSQTLCMYSGHPMGLFPSSPLNPRVVITNGMVIPNYSSKEGLERMYGLGVSLYGQMTAGSYCYIGPQGIVHGTTLTLLGAGRKYLGTGDMRGKVFVTSGLGGMSGAQAKAGVIAGAISIIAEVSPQALDKRHKQGWSLCQESLRRQVKAINGLCQNHNMKFWDYGNSFLLEASRAQADITNKEGKFIYPSYVEDIMGDIFSLGFGPFRWVCTSGDPADLRVTDQAAAQICSQLAASSPTENRQQYEDNLLWIQQAESHNLVVGSQARILYADATGRQQLALTFNKLVKEGKLSGPVVISRDHHDVSGTDSPFRETSNIRDGSMFCADMAVQNFSGLCMRGATWAALHNGGGTGWGEAVNGGFGFVLDGKDSTSDLIHNLLLWDVMNGISRRAWAGNDNATWTLGQALTKEPGLNVTVSSVVDPTILENL